MKKIFKNPIFTFILGSIIFGSIGVVASSLFASDIKYEPEWKKSNGDDITNVAEAIDELYNKSQVKDDFYLEINSFSSSSSPSTYPFNFYGYSKFMIDEITCYNGNTGRVYGTNNWSTYETLSNKTEYSIDSYREIYFEASGSYCNFKIKIYN